MQCSWNTVIICDRDGNCNNVNRIERAGNPVYAYMAKFVLAALIPLVLLQESWSYKFRGYSHNED